jgi:hemerythrin-like metal-binding protein
MWDSLLGHHVFKEKLQLTLDEEHWQLNLLFNGVQLQIERGAPIADQLAALRVLQNSFKANCATEEAIMDECSFPLSKAHKEKHRSHCRSLEEISTQINGSMTNEASAALSALQQGVLAHIRDEDQEVADWKRRQDDGLVQ